MTERIIEVFVVLLEEGSPTIRGTDAIDLGNGLFKLLPTPKYDPEDEIWEFLPGSIVRIKDWEDAHGNPLMLAYEKVETYAKYKNHIYYKAMTHSNSPRLLLAASRFFELEAAGGILLVIAAAIALLIANSSLFPIYDHFFNQVSVLDKSILHWINDGLMAIFFFLVGLEIKREIAQGELSSRDQALLPALAAIGGMAVPALIYAGVNIDSPHTLHGWAIPSATDIAFSLGVLALLGTRAPLSLKVLLTAIAVIDDLGAIVIIALFYAGQIFMVPLAVAVVAVLSLTALNRFGVSRITPYIVVGVVLWVALLKSGLHPTLAGVFTALAIPLSCARHSERRPLEVLEHHLHPWVAYAILPIFAFANAGVPFTGMSLASFGAPVAFGITAGLFAGKLIGILGVIFVAVKAGLCRMPREVNWMHIWGMAHLCGIGFTMSLFIGELAIEGTAQQASIRLGVLTGSILSAIAGYLILRVAGRKILP